MSTGLVTDKGWRQQLAEYPPLIGAAVSSVSSLALRKFGGFCREPARTGPAHRQAGTIPRQRAGNNRQQATGTKILRRAVCEAGDGSDLDGL